MADGSVSGGLCHAGVTCLDAVYEGVDSCGQSDSALAGRRISCWSIFREAASQCFDGEPWGRGGFAGMSADRTCSAAYEEAPRAASGDYTNGQRYTCLPDAPAVVAFPLLLLSLLSSLLRRRRQAP